MDWTDVAMALFFIAAGVYVLVRSGHDIQAKLDQRRITNSQYRSRIRLVKPLGIGLIVCGAIIALITLMMGVGLLR